MTPHPSRDQRRITELESEVRRLRAERDRLVRELTALRAGIGALPQLLPQRDAHAL